MQVYESEYLTIDFEEDNSLFYFKWSANTTHLTDDGYQVEMQNYLAKLEEHKPLRLLIDDQDMQFPIAPEMQAWNVENVYPRAVAAGLRLFAVVMSRDLISQLGTEQSVDENPHPDKLNSSFFETSEEARDWLMRHSF